MDKLLQDCNAILLVGEANFSFSASLIKYLSDSVHITASSYESEEDVEGRLMGSQNVEVLKQHGKQLMS